MPTNPARTTTSPTKNKKTTQQDQPRLRQGLQAHILPANVWLLRPRTYERYRKYDKPQLTLLPSMVHETRFQTKACHGWAENFLAHDYNDVLSTMPVLDGPERPSADLRGPQQSLREGPRFLLGQHCSADTCRSLEEEKGCFGLARRSCFVSVPGT